jgi:hypothetical protein
LNLAASACKREEEEKGMKAKVKKKERKLVRF